MGEMYNEFANFIANSEFKEKVTLRFIDVFEDSLDGHESVKKVLDKGLGLPITVINGKVMLYGGLSTELIMEEIQKL